MILPLFIVLSGCTVKYGFTPSKPPDCAQTIAITLFYNESSGGPPDLSQTFTENLREYYQRNTKLEVIRDPLKADLILEGTITGYFVQPVAPVASGNLGETAAQQKLVIDVNASYVNSCDDNDNFQGNKFSAFALFDASQSLTDVEVEKVEEISEQLILKIFTKTFDSW